MAFLEGLVGGLRGGMGYSDYLTNRQIATDQNRRDQQTHDVTMKEDKASRTMSRLQAAGLIDKKNAQSLDKDAIAKGIESDDQNIKEIGLEIINSSNVFDEGVVAVDITPMSGGGYVIQTRNQDGEIGAVTRDGSSNPNSEVVVFNPGKLAGLANVYWRSSVIPNLSQSERDRFNVYGAEADLINSLTAVRQVGGKEAERAFASALADADTPEQEAEMIQGITGKAPSQPASSVASSEPAWRIAFDQLPDDLQRAAMEENPREADLEKFIKEKYPQEVAKAASSQTKTTASASATAPDPSINADLESQIAEKEKELRAINNKAGGSFMGASSADEQKRRKIEGEIRDLKQQLQANKTGKVSPITGAAPKAAAAVSSAKSIDEIDAAVDSGQVQPDPEEVRGVVKAMQDAGVEKVSDLARLDARDRMLAYAFLRLFTPNEQARENIRQEMSNISETGMASYSAQELDTATTSRMNAVSQRMSETRQGAQTIRENVGSTQDYARTLGGALKAATTDEDGELSISSTNLRNLFAPGGAMALAKTELKTETDPLTQAKKKDVFNANLSSVVMALSSADSGGIVEGIKDAIGWQADQEFIDGTDYQFNRLQGVYKNGVLSEVRIIDPRGGYMDEAVPAGTLQRVLGGQMYNYLSQALRINQSNDDDAVKRDKLSKLMPAGS